MALVSLPWGVVRLRFGDEDGGSFDLRFSIFPAPKFISPSLCFFSFLSFFPFFFSGLVWVFGASWEVQVVVFGV